MDIESTLNFIVDHLASVSARLDAVAESHQQQVQSQQQLRESQQQLTKSQQLLVESQNRLVDSQQQLMDSQQQLMNAHLRIEAQLDRLAEAQNVTESKLQALIDSLNKGANGHP